MFLINRTARQHGAMVEDDQRYLKIATVIFKPNGTKSRNWKAKFRNFDFFVQKTETEKLYLNESGGFEKYKQWKNWREVICAPKNIRPEDG